jgi:putative drug exporter of the RND superfamily
MRYWFLPTLLLVVLVVAALAAALLLTRRRGATVPAASGPPPASDTGWPGLRAQPPEPALGQRTSPEGPVGRIFAAIGAFSVRFRWPVVAVWVAGVIAGVAFLPSLSSISQSNNAGFLPASAPSSHAAQLASSVQPTGRTTVTVVVARSGVPLTAADENAITQLQQALSGVPQVTTVSDAARSQNGQAAQLRVSAQAGSVLNDPAAQGALVNALRSAVSGVSMPAGSQVHLAGPVATAVDNNATSETSGNRLRLLSIVFVIVLLLIVFRSLLAPLVTVVPAFLVVTLAGPLSAEVAVRTGMQVSQVAQLLQIVLVIGAGTDYGLFLVFRVREEMRGGLSPHAAVVEGVTRVGESITFSAATVIAALLSLLAATFAIYSGLAVPLSIGVGLMLVAGLTLLPAVLAILGRVAFWPSSVSAGPQRLGLWGRISARIVRWPGLTLVAGLVVFGGLAAAAPGYQAAGILGGAATAPTTSDSAAGNALLSRDFPQAAANPTGLVFQLPHEAWNEPQALEAAQAQLAADPQFIKVTGPLDPNGSAMTPTQFSNLYAALGPPRALPPAPPAGIRVPPAVYQAYRAAGQYLSPDGRTVEFATALRAGDPTTTPAMQAVPAVRAAAGRVAGTLSATDYGVTGQAATSYDISSLSSSDLRTVIPIAIAVIGVLLALVMRSMVAPLYLIASVAISYFAALGGTVLLFMRLGGQSGLIFILPFLMFVFLLALGEDYNILVMTRIREEAHRLPLRKAVAVALGATGTTVTSAGLVLAGTFAVLALVGATTGGSNGPALRDVGVGLALGVLMDTFLVRTLLVPSTVVLLNHLNWWPSRLSTRRLR